MTSRTERRLPSFVFAGPVKSGSTWIQKALEAHPEVFVPKVKDLWFFDRYYHKGLDWYADFFSDAPPTARALGEVGGNYLYSPEAAERIARDLPAARVFVCVRNPIDRAVSSYQFLRRNGTLTGDFDAAVRERPSIVENGRYVPHLKRYRKLLGEDRWRVFVFDDLRADPHRFARELYAYLGVDASFVHATAGERVNEAAEPRSFAAARWAKRAGVVARNAGLHDLVGAVKHSPVVRRVLYSPAASRREQVLSPAQRAELASYYADDVAELGRMLGRDLSHWLSSRTPGPTEEVHA